jgi:hypothetical protein
VSGWRVGGCGKGGVGGMLEVASGSGVLRCADRRGELAGEASAMNRQMGTSLQASAVARAPLLDDDDAALFPKLTEAQVQLLSPLGRCARPRPARCCLGLGVRVTT